jgi:hypothetical protein
VSRTAIATTFAAALLALAACNSNEHGSVSPTSPGPVVSLLGHWSGPMRVDRTDGARSSCTLNVDFNQQKQGAYGGSYSITCPDGRRQEGALAAAPFEGEWLIDAVSSPPGSGSSLALDGCNWESQPAQLGTRLSGSWLAGGCPSSPIFGGAIDLAKE